MEGVAVYRLRWMQGKSQRIDWETLMAEMMWQFGGKVGDPYEKMAALRQSHHHGRLYPTIQVCSKDDLEIARKSLPGKFHQWTLRRNQAVNASAQFIGVDPHHASRQRYQRRMGLVITRTH